MAITWTNIPLLPKSEERETQRPEKALFKVGALVVHASAEAWGAGKVLDVSSTMVTIHFNDGVQRKIAASHFSSLLPADGAAYAPQVGSPPAAKVAKSPRASRKKQ